MWPCPCEDRNADFGSVVPRRTHCDEQDGDSTMRLLALLTTAVLAVVLVPLSATAEPKSPTAPDSPKRR